MFFLAPLLAGVALFALAYVVYGRRIALWLGVDDTRPTPSRTHADGVDFVATRPLVLFGHHFSSIAGAGPIVGPVIAAMAFGWVPALAWILIGAALVGGVHDFTALIASIRHGGRSIADISRRLIHPATHRALLLFILLSMIYVIIVFLDLTASSFAPVARVAAELPESARVTVREGGAVAAASLTYIALALLFGTAIYRLGVPLGAATAVFVPLVFAAVYAGYRWPVTADMVPALGGSAKHFWSAVLLFYCLAASVLPVWLLLQPRDYLASFLLYGCLLGGVAGATVSALRGSVAVAYPALLGWRDASLGPIFPALFVTIACGAVSGFHSIVASGTTAKQLDREGSARPVGYGAMLVEGILAILAVMTVMALPERSPANPVQIFAGGLGRFLQVFGLPASAATVFGMLAVSTFLLTTLDTCTRLARFLLQELLGLRSGSLGVRLLATVLVLAIPVLVVFREVPGPGGVMMPVWKAIWPAFGASNQLLAALALLVVSGWLRAEGRPAAYVLTPALFMLATTMTALARLAWSNLARDGSAFVGGVSLVLLVLAVWVVADLALHRRVRPAL
ncbi:MAG: carbon starvation protein A [Kiritimatiellae bacterium]|nr:carbon starvation protein A [Kiritimatiellia bacterium]